jgi:hypothetical protein
MSIFVHTSMSSLGNKNKHQKRKRIIVNKAERISQDDVWE